MKPASSSARTRRRQGGAEMPTRRASSTLVMRPSSWSSFRIFQSMASRRADKGHLRFPSLSLDSGRSEEHTSELQSRVDLVCRLLLEKKKSIEQGWLTK